MSTMFPGKVTDHATAIALLSANFSAMPADLKESSNPQALATLRDCIIRDADIKSKADTIISQLKKGTKLAAAKAKKNARNKTFKRMAVFHAHHELTDVLESLKINKDDKSDGDVQQAQVVTNKVNDFPVSASQHHITYTIPLSRRPYFNSPLTLPYESNTARLLHAARRKGRSG